MPSGRIHEILSFGVFLVLVATLRHYNLTYNLLFLAGSWIAGTLYLLIWTHIILAQKIESVISIMSLYSSSIEEFYTIPFYGYVSS